MNLTHRILNIFTPVHSEKIIVQEKFTLYELQYEISNFRTFDSNLLRQVIEGISEDTFELSLKVEENAAIILNSKVYDSFEKKLNEEYLTLEDEPVIFKLEINKKSKDHINIYDYPIFESFWKGLKLSNLLKLIKTNQDETGNICFVVRESVFENFYSRNIYFLNAPEKKEAQNYPHISDNCHFSDSRDYPFTPYYFNLEKRPTKENAITNSLDKLSLLFSVVSIFDITTIKGDEIYYKLNGYKSFEGTLDWDALDITLTPVYFRIFDWIYSEKGNVNDKIGLTRNILSLSLDTGSILISENVYLSIQSGYKTYLQENISKYVEIRNKIVDELAWISQKAADIAANHLGNYQKTIFTFLSFFISVFLLKILKGNDDETVFSTESTVFSLVFLLLSLVFLFFSWWNLNVEKKRLTRKYENLKDRYTDLLDKHDIDRILKEDVEFNYELNYIDKRSRNSTILWFLTVFILAMTVIGLYGWTTWHSTAKIFQIIKFSCVLF